LSGFGEVDCLKKRRLLLEKAGDRVNFIGIMGRGKRLMGQGNSGQAMVEFAFVVGLLAFLLFGIIQWGFIFGAHTALRNATAVGARYATLYKNPPPTEQQIREVTQGAATPLLKSNGVQVTVLTNVVISANTTGVSVQATYNYPVIFPFTVGTNLPKTVTLSAKTIMR
jgi:Flp pilus assembly protein TadG